MPGAGTDGWVVTEKSPTLMTVGVLGGLAIPVVGAVGGWSTVFLPELGLLDGLLAVGVLLTITTTLDVWIWNFWRPTAVRVSERGIEVRRVFGRDRWYAPGSFRMGAARDGCGSVFTTGWFFFLSPMQFSAAKGFFPVAGPVSAGGAVKSSG